MAKSYQDHRREARRLTILRLLEETPRRRENSSVLHAGVDEFGFACTRDEIHTDMHWLAEQGLVTVKDLGPVLIVTITARGSDVALGAAVVPGVKRPSPE